MENTSVFFSNPGTARVQFGTTQGALTTAEAMVMAKCDWAVEKRNLYYLHNEEVVNSSKFSVVRTSDGVELGTVGVDHEPLQNADAFRFFDPIVESGLVTLEAAGALRGGKRVWILAKVVGASVEVVPEDTVDQFLLLAHAHDGSLSIQAGFTEWRRACSNYLQTALRDASRMLKFRHTKNALVKMENARQSFDVARAQLVKNADAYKFLASKPCSDEALRGFIREVFTPGGSDDSESNKTLVNKVFPLFESGRGSNLSRGTFWGAYNAITEYNTHERGRSADARIDNVWFGKYANQNVRALEVALTMAEKA